jgi:hypothetical protein
MRSIWLIRNDCIFNNQVWSDVKVVLRRIQRLILEWKPIFKEKMRGAMMSWSSSLEQMIKEPLRIGNS